MRVIQYSLLVSYAPSPPGCGDVRLGIDFTAKDRQRTRYSRSTGDWLWRGTFIRSNSRLYFWIPSHFSRCSITTSSGHNVPAREITKTKASTNVRSISLLLFLCLVNKPCLVAVFIRKNKTRKKKTFVIARVINRQETKERLVRIWQWEKRSEVFLSFRESSRLRSSVDLN